MDGNKAKSVLVRVNALAPEGLGLYSDIDLPELVRDLSTRNVPDFQPDSGARYPD